MFHLAKISGPIVLGFNQGRIGVGVLIIFGGRVGVPVRVAVGVGVVVCGFVAVALMVGVAVSVIVAVRVIVALEFGVGERVVVVGDSVTVVFVGVRVGVGERGVVGDSVTVVGVRVGEALGVGLVPVPVPSKRYTPPLKSTTYTSPLTSSPNEVMDSAESRYSVFCQFVPSNDNPQIRPLQKSP